MSTITTEKMNKIMVATVVFFITSVSNSCHKQFIKQIFRPYIWLPLKVVKEKFQLLSETMESMLNRSVFSIGISVSAFSGL